MPVLVHVASNLKEEQAQVMTAVTRSQSHKLARQEDELEDASCGATVSVLMLWVKRFLVQILTMSCSRRERRR